MGKKVVIDFEAKYQEAAFDIEQLNKKIVDLEKQVAKTNETSGEMANQLDKVSGGAITKFKGFIGTIKNVTKGFSTLKGAIISTGLGALVVILGSIIQAFRSSEAGQNKFAKIMGVIGSVVGNLNDKLSDLGEWILNDPLGFLKAAFQNIINRVKGLLNLIPSLGKALNQLMKGDFQGAGKTAADAFLLIGTGVENATDKLKEFTNEIKKDAEIAGKISDIRAKADKKERDLIVARAKANRDRAELLEKSIDKEKYSAEERIAFLEEAAKLEEEITQQEINAAILRRDAKIQENSLSKSKKEDLEEEEQLKAKVIELETARLTKQKEVTSQIIALKQEETARLKAEEDKQQAEKDKEIADEAKRQENIQKIRDEFRIKNEDVEAKTELEKLKLQKSRDLLRLEELNATEEQKIELLKYYANQELDITNKLSDEQKKKNEELALAKRKQVYDTLDAVIGAAGEETKMGRALFIARQAILVKEQIAEAKATLSRIALRASEASVDIAKGTASTAKVGFPQNIPLLLAFAAQAAGIISSVKSAVNAAKGSAAGMGGGGGSIASATPQAPSFNIVGAAPENQLAQAIGDQERKPIKAYVVGDDVTNQQALDRKISQGASIG